MSGSAAAALRSGTAIRTISHPASASSLIWASVAAGSRVSAVVIDWTTIRIVAADLDIADIENASLAAWGDEHG